MKKRVVALGLIMMLLSGIVACGGNAEADGISETGLNTQRTTVSGSFTVTVREVIPDYCLDDCTPMVAVVTEFQGPPFVLYVGEEIGVQLNAGETYVFTINEFTVERSKEELQKYSAGAMELLFSEFQVVDFRLATEADLGLDSLQLTIAEAK